MELAADRTAAALHYESQQGRRPLEAKDCLPRRCLTGRTVLPDEGGGLGGRAAGVGRCLTGRTVLPDEGGGLGGGAAGVGWGGRSLTGRTVLLDESGGLGGGAAGVGRCLTGRTVLPDEGGGLGWAGQPEWAGA